MEDEIYTPSGEEFLREIKMLCLEGERLVILVGGQSEYDHAIQFIPKSGIAGWFSRPVDMDALLKTVESAINGEIAPARKRHVLIVDDDATYLRMMHEWMKELYKVTMMDSGTKAIHWLMENTDVDLILLDYEMPSMDGPTVFHMLKEDPSTRDIPVMFLTGKNDREKVVRVVDMRPEDYILKGLGKKMLMEKLETFFSKKRKDELKNGE
jgi:response regulator RpfG family c-di-GMP phosphodiesterase